MTKTVDWEAYAKELGFADIAELNSDAWAVANKLEEIVKSGTSGKMPCKSCGADADWHRDGRSWTVDCERCQWGAAGAIPGNEVPEMLN